MMGFIFLGFPFPIFATMKINGQHYRTIWQHPADPACIQIIDQRWLPHQFVIEDLRTLEDAARAIKDMHVRGAPLIGSAGAYGIYLALLNIPEIGWKGAIEESGRHVKSNPSHCGQFGLRHRYFVKKIRKRFLIKKQPFKLLCKRLMTLQRKALSIAAK